MNKFLLFRNRMQFVPKYIYFKCSYLYNAVPTLGVKLQKTEILLKIHLMVELRGRFTYINQLQF